MLEALYRHVSLQSLIWAILALPLLGVALSLLAATKPAKKFESSSTAASAFSIIFSALSLACSVVVLVTLVGFPAGEPSAITGALFQWAKFKSLTIDVCLLADALSMSMAITISALGFLSSLYLSGFGALSGRRPSAIALLGGLQFFALLSVLGANFFLAVVGLSGLGALVSAGLVRAQSDGGEGPSAGISAISSGIGDACLVAASFYIYGVMQAAGAIADDGLFSFSTLQQYAPYFIPVAGPLSLLIACGTTAKAGVLPLGVWMQRSSGLSSPVAAFALGCAIPAASAYLLIRMGFILVLSPETMSLLAWLGAATALYAALSAVACTKASRSAVYVAMFQSSFVFIAVGIGAMQAAVFHIIVCAATCPLIFFALGSASAELSGEDDLWMMGGLKHKMPITAWTHVIAAAGIAAVFPLAGFFSKDALLRQAFERGYFALWVVSFVALGAAVFALFRQTGLVFFGRNQFPSEKLRRVSEAALTMVVPCMLIATAGIALGLINVPYAIGGAEKFAGWISGVVFDELSKMPRNPSLTTELILMAAMVLWSAHFAILGVVVYSQKREWASSVGRKMGRVHQLMENGFYLDLIPAIIPRLAMWPVQRALQKGEGSLAEVLTKGLVRAATAIGNAAMAMDKRSVQIALIVFVIGAMALLLALTM